jgi:hypothetical protein
LNVLRKEVTMTARTAHYNGTSVLMEMAEFAAFAKGTQRYIRRSLDVGLKRGDPIRRWARTPAEAEGIRAQQRVYRRLDDIRRRVPQDTAIEPAVGFLGALVTVSTFDLGRTWLPCFSAYRFLYERLIGSAVRPWLPASFCAAAALPNLHPEHRRALLDTVGEAAGCPIWSQREPSFLPEWVEKVDATISA